MKIPSALLLVLTLASACDQRTDQPVPPAEEPQKMPVAQSMQAPASSIMRPEVAKEVAEPAPTAAPQELRVVIAFDQGAKLDDAARATLAGLIAQPAFAAGGAITLSGHSDAGGSDADNLATSRRRAEAVRDHLRSLGVDGERISIIALGERRPLAPNAKPDGRDDPQGRQRNRRVEIVVSPIPPPQEAISKARSDTPAAPTE